MLRGVLFDLDDTLADSTGVDEQVWLDIVEVIAERLPDVDREALRERYVGITESHYVDLAAGLVDLPTFRRRRLADAVSPWGSIDDELFARYMRTKDRILDEMRAFPDATDVLRGMRAREIRVGVLTNGPSDFQRRKLAAAGLDQELDAVAISAEIGAAKPDAQAFLAALELLGTTPAETAMVGDSLANDVEGALAAGFGAVVWMNPHAELPRGVDGARSLSEVPALLGLA